jgi:raw score 8.90
MIPDNIEGTFNLTLNKMLFDDQNEKALAIKENSYFWQYLSSFVKYDGKLHREFVEEGDNYVSRVEKTENGYLINGRTFEDLRQESMMETDEGEEGKPAATD